MSYILYNYIIIELSLYVIDHIGFGTTNSSDSIYTELYLLTERLYLCLRRYHMPRYPSNLPGPSNSRMNPLKDYKIALIPIAIHT